LFKIDRECVSFSGNDLSKTVYTSVDTRLQTEMLQKKAEELDRGRAEAREEMDRMLEDARGRAEAILAQAREQAGTEAENARREAETCRGQARREGYDAGLREARLEMEEERRKETDAIRDVLEKIGGERDAVIDSLEGEIIDLVVQITKKVINIQLEKDDRIFVELIKRALTRLKRKGEVVIRVSSDEYQRFFGGGLAEFVVNDETVRASVLEEPHFRKGDCVLESDGETINAGIDSQLKYVGLAFRRAAKDGG